MKVKNIIEVKGLSRFKQEIYKYTEEILTSYLENNPVLSSRLQGKEIFDSVWGPVELNVGEVFIVDSPLVQRLRKVKQLGLASYVYCGADYSRFAHTIGVFKLSDKMARLISKQVNTTENRDYFPQVIRLAAIFHDIGHMYYSHVSERYFTENEKSSQYKDVKGAVESFGKFIDHKPELHEIIGVLIIHSPSVKELLRIAAPMLDGDIGVSEEEIDNIVEYMSCLIMGQVNDERLMPYYQIINGPVDADKCDYLLRDSRATDVPAAVDIDRLIHKICIVEIDKPDFLPESELWRGRSDGKVLYPTIKAAAVEALNQLFMARAIMYNSVYYHQKVRTVETMFRGVLEQMDGIKAPEVMNFTEILKTSDSMFGDYFEYVVAKKNEINGDELKQIQKYLNRINNRCLLKRACSINLSDIDEIDLKEGQCFDMDVVFAPNGEEIYQIENLVKDEYLEICKILGKYDKEVSECKIMEFSEKSSSDTSKLIISFGNGETRKYSDIFQTVTWIKSKESRGKELYLVTDCKYRGFAFLALQKVLYNKYHIYLKDSASMCSKTSKDDILNFRDELIQKGYYDNALLLCSEEILDRFNRDFVEIINKFKAYEGPEGYSINKEIILGFFKQFLLLNISYDESLILIDGVIKLLKNSTFINRELFDKEVRKLFEKICKDTNTIICPLGGPNDSAYHMAYYLNDLSEKIEIARSLTDVLDKIKGEETIVLFDDGAYSGNQVCSIFQEYMGVPLKERTTNEHHVEELSSINKEKLKKCKLIIAYICFNSDNKDKIIESAKSMDINILDIKYIFNMQKKVLFDENIISDEKQRRIVKEHLSNIGLQILQSVKTENGKYKDNWPKERIKKSVLGYNDSQQMVILKSSIPTYTITAFWMAGGMIDGWEWKPLFKRTDK